MGTLDYQKGDQASREQRQQRRLRWFGPSRGEVWKALADEIGARHESSLWTGGRVVAEVRHWQIVLDSFMVDQIVYTRIRAPYVNAADFRFCIFRKHVFSGLAEMLGFQDINVGYPEFDEPFIIRGSDEDRLRRLFSNPRIRELIMAQPKVRFEVKDSDGFFFNRFPDGVDELIFVVAGIIKDIDQLKELYELFAETLAELCRMGSAYDSDPEVRL